MIAITENYQYLNLSADRGTAGKNIPGVASGAGRHWQRLRWKWDERRVSIPAMIANTGTTGALATAKTFWEDGGAVTQNCVGRSDLIRSHSEHWLSSTVDALWAWKPSSRRHNRHVGNCWNEFKTVFVWATLTQNPWDFRCRSSPKVTLADWALKRRRILGTTSMSIRIKQGPCAPQFEFNTCNPYTNSNHSFMWNGFIHRLFVFISGNVPPYSYIPFLIRVGGMFEGKTRIFCCSKFLRLALKIIDVPGVGGRFILSGSANDISVYQ